MLSLLPAIAFFTALHVAPAEPVDVAQTRLAEALADADAIDSIASDRAHLTVTFAIERAGEAYKIVATTARDGAVATVAIRDVGLAHLGLGNLSWLADAMKDASAVTRLDIDDDGAVTLETSDGLRFMAIPGRGSGGNAAVESRWAAEWNNS